MGMIITTYLKLFLYGVKRYHYEQFIGIRKLSEQLARDFLSNPFLTDTWILEKNIPTLDQVNEGEKVSTYCAIHISRSTSTSTEVRTINDIFINSTLLFAYTLVTSTIGYHHNL